MPRSSRKRARCLRLVIDETVLVAPINGGRPAWPRRSRSPHSAANSRSRRQDTVERGSRPCCHLCRARSTPGLPGVRSPLSNRFDAVPEDASTRMTSFRKLGIALPLGIVAVAAAVVTAWLALRPQAISSAESSSFERSSLCRWKLSWRSTRCVAAVGSRFASFSSLQFRWLGTGGRPGRSVAICHSGSW